MKIESAVFSFQLSAFYFHVRECYNADAVRRDNDAFVAIYL